MGDEMKHHYAKQNRGCFCSVSSNRSEAKFDPLLMRGSVSRNADVGNIIRQGGASSVSMLAKALNETTAEERNKAYDDIHGVEEIPDEKPEMVDRWLFELDNEISKIKMHHAAYCEAEKRSKEFVSDRSFRLMFLRTDDFHVKNSAKRIMDYFEEKLELFGSEKLVKNITIQDLDPDDIRALACGAMQVLPVKDRSGRTVICGIPALKDFKSVENAVSLVVHDG